MIPTPAALLAEDAAQCRAFEALGGFSPAAAKNATRDHLRERAAELGFQPNEIEVAVKAALGHRVTE